MPPRAHKSPVTFLAFAIDFEISTFSLQNELAAAILWKILQKCDITDIALAIYSCSDPIDQIRSQRLMIRTRSYPLPAARVYTTTPPDRYRIEICSILLHLAHNRHGTMFGQQMRFFCEYSKLSHVFRTCLNLSIKSIMTSKCFYITPEGEVDTI